MQSNQSEDADANGNSNNLPPVKEIAFHEAGHAVVQYLVKIPIKKVSIIPFEYVDVLGYVEGFPNYYQKMDPTTRTLKYVKASRELWTDTRKIKYIKTYIAGDIAQNFLTDREDIDLDSSDYEMAIALAEDLCGSEEEVNALLTYLWCNTYNMLTLEGNWFLVQALANLLLDQKSISGKNVKEFLQAKQAEYSPSIVKDTARK